MSASVNVNGELVEPQLATVSVFDHGFLYGDAVYETLRTYNGRPFLLPDHYFRLSEAADTLGITVPWTLETLSHQIDRTIEAASPGNEWLVRLVVTRGVGALSPDPVSCDRPSWLIFVIPFTEHPRELYQRGVGIAISPRRRDPLIASIKTGNLIHQVLGARDAKAKDVSEIIFLSPAGSLSDGTRSNVFLVQGDQLLTPSEKNGIVRGITRSMVIEVARQINVEVVEGEFPPEIVKLCSEAFLTSTTRGIMPVTEIDGNPVGNGQAGMITTQLMEAYDRAVRDKVTNTSPQ